MKLRGLVAVSALTSCAAFGAEYNAQANFGYFDSDFSDGYTIQGTYYFDNVNTENTAYAEAAFMGRNNNVGISYSDVSADGFLFLSGFELIPLSFETSRLTLSGQYFSSNDFYGRVYYSDVDDDFADDSIIGGEFGYFLQDNWLIAIGTSSSDGDDPVTIRTKYVGELGDGQFYNFGAVINDEDFWSIFGDYYWQPETSVGLEINDIDAFDLEVRFQHFFSDSFAVRISHEIGDIDTTSFGITGRF